MANRIVRGEILESDKVNKLSWAGEVFYRRLMSVLDDFGRGDARHSILRSKLYPLRIDKVSESDIGKWLSECEEAGLIRVYHVEGKEYLEMFNFGQTVRIKKAKFPPPDDTCKQMQADASMCMSETKRNETKRNELPTGIQKFDPSDYYTDAKQAFEDIKNDELFVESLLRIVHSAGFRSCSEITIMLAVRKFITIESAKVDFTSRSKSDVKKHLVYWMNKNASKIHEYKSN